MSEFGDDSVLPPQPGEGGGDDQAEAWLVYLYSGAADDAGRHHFSQWLRQAPANAKAFARAERVWRELGLLATTDGMAAADADQEATPAPIPVPIQAGQRPRRNWWTALAVAATLVVAVGVWRVQFHDPVVESRYASGVGETRIITLEDQSQVTLSGSSTVVARFTKAERWIVLLSGRAYFDVTPNPARVFRVKAGATQVEVVGTEFDVNKSSAGVRVAVAEGVVSVATTSLDKADHAVRLNAGQQVMASISGQLGAPESFDVDAALAWREGRLRYINTRLDEIVEEVNRYRKGKIVLADKALGDIRITTTFKTDETDRLLSGLEAVYPVTISRTPSGVLIKPNGQL